MQARRGCEAGGQDGRGGGGGRGVSLPQGRAARSASEDLVELELAPSRGLALVALGLAARGAGARRTRPHAARHTPHAARRTPHAARRTPHAACRTPLLALWQIVLEERCLGQTTCMFVVNDDLFGGDPCVGKQKRYAGCHPWHSTLSTTLALARWLPPCRRAPHVHCMCACLEMHVHAQCALRVQAGCAAGMRRSSRGGDGGQGGQGQEVRPLGTRNAPAP